MWELIGPNKTLKNQPVCWQDGRVFADNESWIVDSCTKCICQVRFWKYSSLQKWNSSSTAHIRSYLLRAWLDLMTFIKTSPHVHDRTNQNISTRETSPDALLHLPLCEHKSVNCFFYLQDSKIVCNQITCPAVSCVDPAFVEGECCPVCSHCEYLAEEKDR